MRIYIVMDGREYEATNARELLRKIHAASYAKRESDQAFMRDAAERAEMYHGKPIRTDDPETWLRDLIAAGVIREAAIN